MFCDLLFLFLFSIFSHFFVPLCCAVILLLACILACLLIIQSINQLHGSLIPACTLGNYHHLHAPSNNAAYPPYYPPTSPFTRNFAPPPWYIAGSTPEVRISRQMSSDSMSSLASMTSMSSVGSAATDSELTDKKNKKKKNWVGLILKPSKIQRTSVFCLKTKTHVLIPSIYICRLCNKKGKWPVLGPTWRHRRSILSLKGKRFCSSYKQQCCIYTQSKYQDIRDKSIFWIHNHILSTSDIYPCISPCRYSILT